jgi:hypothetical protein
MEIYLNQQFIDERLLPLLIISVPKNFYEKYGNLYEALEINHQ